MAGDWIKMRSALRSSPKVVRIASALKADKRPDTLRVVGALHAVWSLADEHSEDGHLDGYTLDSLDDAIGWPGLAAAMQSVQWLSETPQGLEFPRFDEHNGASAKRRAMESERKRRGRIESGQTSASDADKKRTREEKRRVKPPISPPDEFRRFWETWPKSERKGGKSECLAKWLKLGINGHAEAVIAHVETMKQSRTWTEDNGKYIPTPLVYLNKQAWDGAEKPDPKRERLVI